MDRHSNDRREDGSGNDKYGGPCTGKGTGENDQRFIIGGTWETKEDEVNEDHKDVLLPPRRRHMCTSNLENLNVDSSGLSSSKVNDSFLGDVLLAAKYEGGYIKNNLSDKGDDTAICTAMKYSFADIGDIIRGKDLWDQNRDVKQLQENLKTIFW
ncbi:hypothetical protein PFNF54_00629 [Plasmodium falciparum NF54]|nr:hypothetical protein PFNF54_00629 [Plasmodium falciparum NF54]